MVDATIKKVKMFETDYDPGHIEGYIVMKKSIKCFEEYTIVAGYDWEDEDIGGWIGLGKKQVPVYETRQILIGKKDIWQVYIPLNNERYTSKFNGDLYYF